MFFLYMGFKGYFHGLNGASNDPSIAAKFLFNTANELRNNSKGKNENINTLLSSLDEVNKNCNINIKEFESYNKILAVLHSSLGAGFALYFYDNNKKYGTDYKDSIDTTYREHIPNLDINVDTQSVEKKWTSDEASYSPDIKTVEELIVLFFSITSLFHVYYASNVNGNYEKMLENGNNWVRWIEYSITSTIMLYIIAILSGVKDEGVYTSIFSINIAMIYAGQLVEEYADDEIEFMGKMVPKWIVPMTLGFVLLLAEFNVIIKSFNNNISSVDKLISNLNKYKDFPKDSDEYKKYKLYLEFSDKLEFPSWLKYTVYGLFAFFSSFGFVSLYGVVKKEPYEKTEKRYLLLSLISKAFLGGIVAYGLGQRNKVKPIGVNQSTVSNLSTDVKFTRSVSNFVKKYT